MRARSTLAVPLSILALVVGSCGSSEGDSQRVAGAPTGDLEPSGMMLVGATASADLPSSVAIDGAGNVWTTGPWELTLVDTDGQATTWDVADDLGFATSAELTPSNGTGVWLVHDQSVQLFDGSRFIADLEVPDDLMQIIDDDDPSGFRGVRGVTEVGAREVWVTVVNDLPPIEDDQPVPLQAGRVVAFSEGEWRTVADFPGEVVSDIVVDRTGTPWVLTNSITYTDGVESSAASVKRWDGTAFVTAAADDQNFPERPSAIVAAADAGVYVLGYSDSGYTLHRFDENSWSVVPPDAADDIGDCFGSAALAADSTGAWVASSAGISHVTTDGEWSHFGAENGIEVSDTSLPGVVARDDTVVARTPSGLQVFSSGQFSPLWVDDTMQAHVGWWPLQAVSANEVWAGVSRYADGAWTQPLGEDSPEGVFGTRATDGALWFVTPTGVTRVDGGDVAVVAADITAGAVTPGPDGSVWVALDGDVVRLEPDGSRTSIGHPDEGDVACVLASGGDGSVWVDIGCETSPVPILFRWDGSNWQPVDLPSPDVWLNGMTVTDDNTAWAAFVGVDPQDPNSGVARYLDGAWQVNPGWPGALVTAPGGLVCSTDDPNDSTALRCYDADGLRQTIHLPLMADVSIAPDGTIWVSGEQIARLSDTVSAS